jgi:hypothetical protein
MSNGSSGVGFFGLLTLLFIGLKLGGVISWPWPWVLCPLWIGLAVSAAIVCCLVAFAAACGLVAFFLRDGR